MTKNIQYSFALGPPVRGGLFIDRKSILRRAFQLLLNSKGNVLISGERRVGKTSLCLKLLDQCYQAKGIAAAYMSMEADYGQNIDEFTQSVLLHAIKSVARSLFNKSYSDLLTDIGSANRVASDYQSLLRLFNLARQKNIEVTAENTKEIGATAIASAKIKESQATGITVPRLSSFEYLEILEDVLRLARDHLLDRTIVFIDEANKLTFELNSMVIRNNLSVLASKGLQLCFVTTPGVFSSVPEARELFQENIRIEGFGEPSDVEKLIEAYCRVDGTEISALDLFSSDAIDAIWRLSKGLPLEIQTLCAASLKYSINTGSAYVTIQHVLDSAKD